MMIIVNMDELFVKGNQKETAHASFKAVCGVVVVFFNPTLHGDGFFLTCEDFGRMFNH